MLEFVELTSLRGPLVPVALDPDIFTVPVLVGEGAVTRGLLECVDCGAGVEVCVDMLGALTTAVEVS